jgi:hypothetical protein
MWRFFENWAPAFVGANDVKGAAAVVLLVIVGAIVRYHRKRRREGKALVEPGHLVLYGTVGIAICLIMVAGGLIWQNFRPSVNAVAATREATPPPSSELIQFRLEVNRFVRNNIADIWAMWPANVNMVTNDYNRVHNDKKPQSKEEDDRALVAALCESFTINLRTKFDKIRQSANSPSSTSSVVTDQRDILEFLSTYQQDYQMLRAIGQTGTGSPASIDGQKMAELHTQAISAMRNLAAYDLQDNLFRSPEGEAISDSFPR